MPATTSTVPTVARPARISTTPFIAHLLARIATRLDLKKGPAARRAIEHWLCPPPHTLPSPDHRFLRSSYTALHKRGRPVRVHVRPSGQAATTVAAIQAATNIPTAHIWAKALTRGVLELAESLGISTDPDDYLDVAN